MPKSAPLVEEKPSAHGEMTGTDGESPSSWEDF